jgi:hypothetical protein
MDDDHKALFLATTQLPCSEQSDAAISKYYLNIKVGDPVCVKETQYGLLRYYITTVEAIKRGRIYPVGHHAFWAKTGKNCWQPMGQSRLVIPTEKVRIFALKYPPDLSCCFSRRTDPLKI